MDAASSLLSRLVRFSADSRLYHLHLAGQVADRFLVEACAAIEELHAVGMTELIVLSLSAEASRFGKIVGPDPLIPSDVPHWREIALPTGKSWVNLNGAGIRNLAREEDHSRSVDSRCTASAVSRWLDLDGDGKVTEQEALKARDDQTARERLSRLICRVESEWDPARLEARWSWLTRSENGVPARLNAEGFEQFKKHARALCIDHKEVLMAKWRFKAVE